MSRTSFVAAFAAGLAALFWISFGFVGASWLPLLITAAIAGTYLLGAWELQQLRRATQGLHVALAGLTEAPADLASWLARVPASLRDSVRARVEGGRGALPGPALTPYLVGLLVMLGMLGTFLGLVITFRGAVFVLEGSSDLQAIRSALSEPIRGLGLSFGTSVAGVAASAMLGLMSAIARRERLAVLRELDRKTGTELRPFSLAQQRQASFDALHAQSQALPTVVQTMGEMMARIEERSRQLDERLLQGQAELQREVTAAYGALASKVGTALQSSLESGAKAAGEAIRPVVEATMAQLAQDADALRKELASSAQAQAAALSQQLATTLTALEDSLARRQESMAASDDKRLAAWTGELQSLGACLQAQSEQGTAAVLALAQRAASDAATQSERVSTQVAALTGRMASEAAALVERSAALVAAQAEGDAQRAQQQGARMDQLASAWRSELQALRDDEARRGEAAVASLGALQEAVTRHLAQLGAALEEPMTRLIHTASEVPQAAAGVITELRQEMGRQTERENLALQERTQLVEELRSLMQSVEQAAGEQRAASEALSVSAAASMAAAGEKFTELLGAHAAGAGDASQRLAQGALEVGQLAQAFGQSVQSFEASNDKLLGGLDRIEASLVRATERSDEQLAYYVAQAREVIDLSIASQQGLVEQLHQSRERAPKAAA